MSPIICKGQCFRSVPFNERRVTSRRDTAAQVLEDPERLRQLAGITLMLDTWRWVETDPWWFGT